MIKLIKNKKGAISQTVRIILWLGVLAILTVGVYLLLQSLMNF